MRYLYHIALSTVILRYDFKSRLLCWIILDFFVLPNFAEEEVVNKLHQFEVTRQVFLKQIYVPPHRHLLDRAL